MNLGCDISFLSAFPHEKELLYPPLTFLQPTGVASHETCPAGTKLLPVSFLLRSVDADGLANVRANPRAHGDPEREPHLHTSGVGGDHVLGQRPRLPSLPHDRFVRGALRGSAGRRAARRRRGHEER